MNRRRHMMEDLEQDIRHHIAIETQENMESGMSTDEARRSAFAQKLALFLSAVVLVLLIACANVAGLFFSRTFARRESLAIQIALSAAMRVKVGPAQ